MASSSDKENLRGKGELFSDSQREYLKGEKSDISDNYETTIKTRIRQRVIGALKDIQLLENLDNDDRQYIYNSDGHIFRGVGDLRNTKGKVGETPTADEFLNSGSFGMFAAYQSLFKFFYKSAREDGEPPEGILETIAGDIERLEHEILSDKGEGHFEVEATVEIDQVKQVDIDDAKERFENQGISGVSTEELKALSDHGQFEYIPTDNTD